MKKASIKHLQPLKYTGNEAINTICSNISFVGNDVKVRSYIKDKIGDDIVSADIYFFDKNDLLLAQIADYRCVCTDSIK